MRFDYLPVDRVGKSNPPARDAPQRPPLPQAGQVLKERECEAEGLKVCIDVVSRRLPCRAPSHKRSSLHDKRAPSHRTGARSSQMWSALHPLPSGSVVLVSMRDIAAQLVPLPSP